MTMTEDEDFDFPVAISPFFGLNKLDCFHLNKFFFMFKELILMLVMGIVMLVSTGLVPCRTV